MTDPRHDLGHRAESIVAEWLRAMGWRILARRWKVSEGELDLVAVDPLGTLVGLEVRGRRSARTGSALESIDRRHVARLRAALVRYAISEPVGHQALRLDLVALDRSATGWRMVRHAGIDGW
ncbi:MAG: YraN family protein [Chloroflexi bacterium]|nr:MAG: YraN family protein [Chloroflexota bacterium]